MALTSDQLADLLSEGTGTTIQAGTLNPTQSSKKLSWEEFLKRQEEGDPIEQGELLPDIPEGMTATQFYRFSGISPTAFSQKPFSSFEGSIANANAVDTATADNKVSANTVNTEGVPIRSPIQDEDMGYGNEYTEGPGPQALAGVSLGAIFSGSMGMFSEMMQGTAFLDYSHMMDTGGSFYHDHKGKTVYMNETLWRDWDNLDKTQKDMLAEGNYKMAQDPTTGMYFTTNGHRYKNASGNYQMVDINNWNEDSWKATAKGDRYGTTMSPGFNKWGLMGDAEESDSSEGISGAYLDFEWEDTENTPYSPEAAQSRYTSIEQAYDGGSGGDDDDDSGFSEGTSYGDEDSYGFKSGGKIKKMQDGGEAEMANLGMINEQAAGPQNGGQQSVKDDIPREADAGDYILPYETVLEVGLKQLNRYAKEAIQLAIENGVSLKGTDLDPSDDVPIKVSNYEYHIPKGLVPYFGGGKKYLDKIRSEGLALRKRLEEEKQPSAQEQQPMEQNAQPTPPQPQMVAEAQPMQPAPQQPPMMQRGGFVLGRNNNNIESEEQVLAQDTSQPAQSAYNQMQAIERSRVQSQQPPMVNPDGKVVQQGFAAPQGYQDGSMVEDNPDIAEAVEPKAQPPMPDWANRALDPKTPILVDPDTGEPQTVRTMSREVQGKEYLFPTIRLVGKELKKYDEEEALSIALKKKDYIMFDTPEEATEWSTNFSDTLSKVRNLQKNESFVN
tara:strand:+ start:2506 stop:4677 length:2172 start_codon:yes stop_codon:yes gene_type:complete